MDNKPKIELNNLNSNPSSNYSINTMDKYGIMTKLQESSRNSEDMKLLEARILSFRQELKKYSHFSLLELYDQYFNIKIYRKGNEDNTLDGIPEDIFKICLQKALPITKEYLESKGWEMYSKSVDMWFKFKESPVTHTQIQELYAYKPYALYLNYGFHDQKMKIKCDFSGGLNWDDSDTLFEGRVITQSDYEFLCKLVGIYETNTFETKSETSEKKSIKEG